MSTPFQFTLAWLLAYVALVAIVVGGLVYGRAQAIAIYGSPAAQADWDTWRADAQKMAGGPGPVTRRPPKSAEPPALVLMRDHFAVCLTGSVLITSVLFGTFWVFVRGALGGRVGSAHHSISEPRS